jgi:hypothetical protein
MFDNELAFDKLRDSLGAETLLDNLVQALTADERSRTKTITSKHTSYSPAMKTCGRDSSPAHTQPKGQHQ